MSGGVVPTFDGGVIIFWEGKRELIQQPNGGETLPHQREAVLVKLDAMGEVEWGRGFQEAVVISAVEAFRDGTSLISLRNWKVGDQSAMLARLSGKGLLLGDPYSAPRPIQMRDDGDPPKIDLGEKVLFGLSDQTDES